MDRYDFNRLLAEAARAMAEEAGTQLTLNRAVLMATELIEKLRPGRNLPRTPRWDRHPAASHEALQHIDELQYELSEGPCLDALKQTDVLVVTNLAEDPRWPNWGPHIAHELDLHSSTSFRLFTTGDNLGALNLYATKVDAFSHEDLLDGLALAAHAAVALSGTFEEDHLHRALETRRMIGEATGILRERYALTTEQAWGVLRRVSSQHNIKLHRVAQQLVDTGALPDTNG